MSHVPLDLVKIALERVSGDEFEKFTHQFLSALLGQQFVPLGGMRDGGADGLWSESIYESSGTETFFQAAIRPDYEAKIAQTVKRLREFGRSIRILYYLTQKIVQRVDQLEDTLTLSLGCSVKIRDLAYITNHINDSQATIAAYREHLEQYTLFLQQVGSSKLIASSAYVQDPSVYVFLEQEVANRIGNAKLNETITDALILWSLDGTDPDAGRFMSRREVIDKITSTLPWARTLAGNIPGRLEKLSDKGNLTGRQIRWHKKEDDFCLPYETRQVVLAENASDECLRMDVRSEIIASLPETTPLNQSAIVAAVAIRTVELFFESEGLSASYFFVGKDQQAAAPNTVSDRIEQALSEAKISTTDLVIIREHARDVLRRMFYASSERQRQYLLALSRTYLLLFTLKAEPRVIDYFQNMSSKFHLYIGTDILLLALTERYVPVPDQRARNLLRMSQFTGIRLLLSESILEELYTHICATDYEFKNNYAEIEPYVDHYLASQSDRILIRTYFYAKTGGAVKGWKSFIDQFAAWATLHSGVGKDELRDYLIAEFGLEHVSKNELEQLCNMEKVRNLAQSLVASDAKKREDLALNDALMVYSVYALRLKNREAEHSGLEFGYLTWWLTHETKIQRYTVDLVRDARARYIMRPEFLLNYFALCPNREDVMTTYRYVFPSTLGIQMGHRLAEDALHEILGIIRGWRELDPGRRTVKIKALTDRLKTDQMRNVEFRVEAYSELAKL